MDLLLRVWRGDTIDWVQIEKDFMPSRTCATRGFTKKRGAFTAIEWKRGDEDRIVLGNRNMCLTEKKL